MLHFFGLSLEFSIFVVIVIDSISSILLNSRFQHPISCRAVGDAPALPKQLDAILNEAESHEEMYGLYNELVRPGDQVN